MRNCPFCASPDVFLVHATTDHHCVRCSNCGAAGPCMFSPETARQRWDDRRCTSLMPEDTFKAGTVVHCNWCGIPLPNGGPCPDIEAHRQQERERVQACDHDVT